MKCNTCHAEKKLNLDNFSYRKDTEKWRNTCKECVSKKNHLNYLNNAESIKEKNALYRVNNKEARIQQVKKYNSKETTKEKQKLYRKNNKEKITEKNKEWIEDNPEKYKEISRRKSKKQASKLKNKIKNLISGRIAFHLRSVGSSKNYKSCLDFVDFTIDQLKKHLENKFEPWMTWENRGKYNFKTWDDNDPNTWTWQIDHIIPHSTFAYKSMEDQAFKECWSLDNLRPLSSKQNCIDGARRVRHL